MLTLEVQLCTLGMTAVSGASTDLAGMNFQGVFSLPLHIFATSKQQQQQSTSSKQQSQADTA